MDDVLSRGGEVPLLVEAWRSVDAARRKLQGDLDKQRQERNVGPNKWEVAD